MSTKAKLTLLTSVAITSTIIYQVHYGQLQERNVIIPLFILKLLLTK
jgi:hypothetical protein